MNEPIVRIEWEAESLTRNAAIWPRVTKSSGQYSVFDGGSHPRVIPDRANALMSPSNTEVSSSVKKSSNVVGRLRGLPTNAAIRPRVTGSVGQNRSLIGGLHPRVIPKPAMNSVSPS